MMMKWMKMANRTMKSYCSSQLDSPGSLDRLDMCSSRMG